VTLSRKNLLIAVGVVLAVSVMVLLAHFAGGGSAAGGGY
jgi:F0F1-type ATP synthase assembly protein I